MKKQKPYGSAPIDDFFDKVLFIDPTREKEWNSLPDSVKRTALYVLKEHVTSMTNQTAIEMLCHVINDLVDRVDKLENNQ